MRASFTCVGTRRVDAAMSEASIGLSAAHFCRAFPFHFVVDERLIVTQAGPGLAKIAVDTRPGAYLEDVYELRRPLPPLTVAKLRAMVDYPVLIDHRRSGITFRGQFLPIEDNSWAFLGSPWFDSAETLEASGLLLSDFAVHDPIADLLMASRTQFMAMDDLKQLAARLDSQREALIRTENLYRGAIAAARAVPYREDLDHDSFEFIGEGIEVLTGYPAGEMTPELFRSLIVSTSDAPTTDATQVQAAPDGTVSRRRDLCIRSRSGELRWINDASVLVLEGGGRTTGAVGMLLDVTARKRTEQQLRESEAHSAELAEVVERTQSGVLITDSRRRITWSNEAFRRLTGFAEEELLGHLPREILRFDEASAPDLVARLDVGEAGNAEVRVTAKDGRQLYLAVEIQPKGSVHGPLGQWMFVVTDVTARRQVEEQLRQSQAEAGRLALVAARTDNAVILTDVRRRIEWVNDGFTRLTGYTLEEVAGRVPGHILQRESADAVTVDYMRRQLDQARGFQCEVQNHRKDGSKYWTAIECQPIHDEQGRHTGFMAIESDITARKRYEDRLEQLSTELDAILKLSPDGYAAFDAADKLSYCNPAFEDMLEHERSELRGLGYEEMDGLISDVLKPDSVAAPILSIDIEGSDRIQLKGPPPRVISRSLSEVRTPRGEVNGRVLCMRDVTQEVEMDRMKTDFLSTAAHELRTPMTSVQGFSELLMNGELDTETARDVASTIHRQSSILVHMVNELLDLQRIEQGRGQDFEMSRTALQPLLQQAVGSLHVKDDERDVSLSGFDGEPIWVNIDSRRIVLALTNVLSNAYKYSPRGSDIVVSLQRRVRSDANEVGIVVTDRGIGMTQTQVVRVFERFYRVDPSGATPGTGLGMSLVKEIIELHGGRVEVTSELGAGTAVTLWFPEAV
jgi:PAS domain S-box-containing protein